jgi:hypothetical protein
MVSAQPGAPGGTELPCYDLFNGDADGLCALHQLRLHEPRKGTPITGVKRDIELVRRLPKGMALEVSVLDICFDRNVDAVREVLDNGGRVAYFDHHAASTLFEHPRLQVCIDRSADVCTALLVNRHLAGLDPQSAARCRDWAIVGAFGDNLLGVARTLAQRQGHGEQQTASLEHLGMLLNYNAYGESVEDLHMDPLALYQALQGFDNPLDFIEHSSAYALLRDGHVQDQHRLASVEPQHQDDRGEVFVLGGESWMRRLSGSLANQRVAMGHGRSVAVLTQRSDGGYLVSVRASSTCAEGADELCRRYPGGNGRRAAAGIDRLPESALERFLADFFRYAAGRLAADSCQA